MGLDKWKKRLNVEALSTQTVIQELVFVTVNMEA